MNARFKPSLNLRITSSLFVIGVCASQVDITSKSQFCNCAAVYINLMLIFLLSYAQNNFLYWTSLVRLE